MAVSVARAFQPEFCAVRLGPSLDRRTGPGVLQAVGLTRSREAAKLEGGGGWRRVAEGGGGWRFLSAAFRR